MAATVLSNPAARLLVAAALCWRFADRLRRRRRRAGAGSAAAGAYSACAGGQAGAARPPCRWPKTGDTVRDFCMLADGVALAPPYAADFHTDDPRVARGSRATAVRWCAGAAGESSVVPEGWKAACDAEAALSHRYTGGGTYQVEYATKVEGAWDSRVISSDHPRQRAADGIPAAGFWRRRAEEHSPTATRSRSRRRSRCCRPANKRRPASCTGATARTPCCLRDGAGPRCPGPDAFTATGRYAIEYRHLVAARFVGQQRRIRQRHRRTRRPAVPSRATSHWPTKQVGH